MSAMAGELVRARVEPELLGADAPGEQATMDEDVLELRRVRRVRRGISRDERPSRQA